MGPGVKQRRHGVSGVFGLAELVHGVPPCMVGTHMQLVQMLRMCAVRCNMLERARWREVRCGAEPDCAPNVKAGGARSLTRKSMSGQRVMFWYGGFEAGTRARTP